MDYLYIGKYVNTHGLKGEIRILSNFKHKDKVFIPGMKFYLGKDKQEYEMVGYRRHKNFDMVTFKDINDINLIENLKGSLVYINKADLKLDKNVYLAIDLIGFNAIINDKVIGVVNDVIETPANEVLVVGDNIMIPYVDEFINKVDIDNKKVFINDMKGLL